MTSRPLIGRKERKNESLQGDDYWFQKVKKQNWPLSSYI